MAAYLAYIFVFIVFTHNFNSTTSVERKFSNLKRCADEECSMLLCRGKAVRDFYGTDCRFLTFKEGETIYVYYKLSGRRTDVWAGSVGSRFGYFPKDLLAINHIYTEKELEVPTEETDFVCFETGHDKFDNYDIDSLLRSSLTLGDDKAAEHKNVLVQNESPERSDVEEELSPTGMEDETDSDSQEIDEDSLPDEVPSDGEPSNISKDTNKKHLPNEGEEGDGEQGDISQNIDEDSLPDEVVDDSQHSDISQDIDEDSLPDDVVDNSQHSDISQDIDEDSLPDEVEGDAEQGNSVPSDSSVPALKAQTELSVSTEVAGSIQPSSEPTTDDLQKNQQVTSASVADAERDDTKNAPSEENDHLTKDGPDEPETQAPEFSEGRPIPKLKTTLGTTFDAVTSDDEDTWRVTPYEEEESDDEDHHDDHSESPSTTPLLSSTENSSVSEQTDIAESEVDDLPEREHYGEQSLGDRSMWTSLGDKVFAIVSGGERTPHVPGSEEEEDDDEDENDIVSEPPEKSIELGGSDKPPATDTQGPAEDLQPLAADLLEPDENDSSDELIPEDEGEMAVGDQWDEPSPSSSDEERSEQTEDDLTAPPTKQDDNAADHQSNLEYSKTNMSSISNDNEEEEKDEEEKDVHGGSDGEVEDPTDVGLQAEQKTDADDFREHDMPQNATEESDQEHTVEEKEREEDLHRVESEQEETKSRKPPIADTKEESTKESEHKQSVMNVDNKFGRFREYLMSVKNTTEQETIQESPSEEELIDPAEDEEELLEDENAVLSSEMEPAAIQGQSAEVNVKQTESSRTEPEMVNEDIGLDGEEIDTEFEKHKTDGEAEDKKTEPEEEPEYSDSVLRLTVLRDHFKEEQMLRFQTFLGLKNLFKVEALFSDLEEELRAVRLAHTDNGEDIEKALEVILEASETPILDEIERMLDSQSPKYSQLQQQDAGMFDEEAAILDDFQELAFNLRQKYSAASDSTPLATESQVETDTDGDASDVMEEENIRPNVPEETIDDDNSTVMENAAEIDSPNEEFDHDEKTADMDIEDGGHFNRNQDSQPSFEGAEEVQVVPQPILDSAFDIGLSVETEPASSGSLPSPSVTQLSEEGLFTSASSYVCSLISLLFQYCGAYVFLMISVLPEEWKPGPTFMGLPWAPVLTTMLVGLVTAVTFLWKSILIVRKNVYLASEKDMKQQLQKVTREKDEIVAKSAELKKRAEELNEQRRMSAESANSARGRVKELEKLFKETEKRNEQLSSENNSIMQSFEEEKSHYQAYVTKVADLEKTVSKLTRSLKKTQDTLAKANVHMDEAKNREDVRSAQHQCLEREYAMLKEQNNSLKKSSKDSEDRNHDLCEQIKVFQKSQKEFEDAIAQKDHSNEVLSELLLDLETYDLQKGDTRVVANGDAVTVADKTSAVRNRIKQLLDVSRVQTTLSIVEEERNKFQSYLEKEEKARKRLEEKYQELEHKTTALKREKNTTENQLKILQQKNEIMTEMYQQKEIALQKRLTNEELERRDKEMKLSEVDGKALEAEQEVQIYRQRIKEMELEVKKTEKALKVQIAEQERKAHENWVAANASERCLSQEKTLSRNLREKLAALSSQLNDIRAANAGRPAVPRGDSYGPSPVSGGAPSPPLMIEGPGRPLSAPIGRRIDPFGPRPPNEKHTVPSRSESAAPRTSSPANMDDSSSRPQGPGSFMESPIRVSPGPGPLPHGLPPPGPRGAPPPPFGHGYRPPPPPSHLLPGGRPANEMEGMDFRFRARSPNGHPAMMAPRPRPPMGPPGPGMRFPPNHPPHHGPVYRGGPPGPYGTPYHQDIRFNGPRDYPMPPPHLPLGGPPPPHLPPGGPPPPPQGGFPPHLAAQGPRDSFVGPPPIPGQGQDYTSQQAAPLQDSARSAMAEP